MTNRDTRKSTAPTRKLVRRLVEMGYNLEAGVSVEDVRVIRKHYGDGFGWGFDLVYWHSTCYHFAFTYINGANDSIGRLNAAKQIGFDANLIYVDHSCKEGE